METKLLKVKNDFNNIITIRNSVKNVFDILQSRIDKLRQMYTEFIENNKTEMFVFGLDSFHFQSKLIDIEHDDMKRLFLVINNRMYCEYFKLNKIITDYIVQNINDKKMVDMVKNVQYPIYKDLEPFKEYKFEVLLDIHENILNMLSSIMSIINNKENELSIYQTKQSIGLNIDNFITTFNYNISVMKEKVFMFITYIEFFHKMHTKYLKRFNNKVQLMYTHINNDIKFDDSVEISKNKKKELINELSTNNIDENLLKDLKISIGSETNSESDECEMYVNTNHIYDNNVDDELSFSNENINNQFVNLKNINHNKNDEQAKINKNVSHITKLLNQYTREEAKTPEQENKNIEKFLSDINLSCDSIINDEFVGLDISYNNNNNKSNHSLFDINTQISDDIHNKEVVKDVVDNIVGDIDTN